MPKRKVTSKQLICSGKVFYSKKNSEHLEKVFTNPAYDTQIWRIDRYWNEDCDYCLKNYKRIIDYVYKSYSGISKKIKEFSF